MALLLSQFAFVFLLLPPFLLLGYLVHLPAILLTAGLARLGASRVKDVASLKILIGAVLFPLTWLAAGVGAYLGSRRIHELFPAVPDRPLAAAGLLLACAILGGVASVRYAHVARRTATALRVRATRVQQRRTIARLRRERSSLHDEFVELVTSPSSELEGSGDSASATST